MKPYPWEAAIRRMYDGKGVRQVSRNSFEAYISCHGKFLHCGHFPSAEQAQEAIITYKIAILSASAIANGDNPEEMVESVEKGYFVTPNGNIYNRHGDLMIGANDRCGYRHAILNRKNRNIHRIVAETFLPNPDNLPCVNHKDGNKQNNRIDNLEWCTHSENTKHSYRMGLQKSNGRGEVKKYVDQD